MEGLTNSEKLEVVKSTAKAKGFAFVENGTRSTGRSGRQRLYMLICPCTGRMLVDNYQLEDAFKDTSNGHMNGLTHDSFIS